MDVDDMRHHEPLRLLPVYASCFQSLHPSEYALLPVVRTACLRYRLLLASPVSCALTSAYIALLTPIQLFVQPTMPSQSLSLRLTGRCEIYLFIPRI